MREIEIRMWNGISKKYHYDVENVFTCLAQQNVFDNNMPSRGFTHAYNHIGEGSIFEQFTGFKDKNGTKIFEGDILLCKQATEPEEKGFLCRFRDNMIAFDNMNHLNSKHYSLHLNEYDYIKEQLEIIGNIHENK